MIGKRRRRGRKKIYSPALPVDERAPDIVSACCGEESRLRVAGRGEPRECECESAPVWVNVRGEVAGRRNSSNRRSRAAATAAAVNTGATALPPATETRESNFEAMTFRNAPFGRPVGRSVGRSVGRTRLVVHVTAYFCSAKMQSNVKPRGGIQLRASLSSPVKS